MSVLKRPQFNKGDASYPYMAEWDEKFDIAIYVSFCPLVNSNHLRWYHSSDDTFIALSRAWGRRVVRWDLTGFGAVEIGHQDG